MEAQLPVPAHLNILASANGLCPNCGDEVGHHAALSGDRSMDLYACPSCGLFAYSSGGPSLPLVVPVPPWARAGRAGM